MANTHPARELLTTASFALIAGVVPDTVRVWRRSGKVTPAFRTPSGIALYRRADAERIARHASITTTQRYMNARANSLAESMRQARVRRLARATADEQTQVG